MATERISAVKQQTVFLLDRREKGVVALATGFAVYPGLPDIYIYTYVYIYMYMYIYI